MSFRLLKYSVNVHIVYEVLNIGIVWEFIEDML